MSTGPSTTEVLERFCSKDESRPAIGKPFSFGSFTVATDGRSLIRVPRLAEVPESKDNLCPNEASVTRLFAQCPEATPWQDVPTPPKPGTEECDACDGLGYNKCPTCDNETKCNNCDGLGFAEVKQECVLPIIGTQVSAKFNAIYIRRIVDLPGVKIAVCGDIAPMHFKFDGGDGLIMPMRV